MAININKHMRCGCGCLLSDIILKAIPAVLPLMYMTNSVSTNYIGIICSSMESAKEKHDAFRIACISNNKSFSTTEVQGKQYVLQRMWSLWKHACYLYTEDVSKQTVIMGEKESFTSQFVIFTSSVETHTVVMYSCSV